MSKEDEIINSILKGDRDAFALCYREFSEYVYNTALSYTKNTHDAEEVTQDVFIKIFKNASKFKGESSLSTWIYRITINTSLNFLKKKNNDRRRLEGAGEYLEIDFNHPGVLLENKENAAKLFKVMEGLVDSQKTAFILCFIEDLPRKKVAEIMEISLKAVESLLQRAKQNMREELRKTFPNRRKSKK